jgi:hypothetical protein
MNSTNRAEYTALDFAQWKAGDSLVLSPKFQRHDVWKPAARSFFIDSLLRRMPVPPIYMRQVQSEKKDRVIREVVDGQQRVAAVLDFIDGQYRLSRTLKGPWAGKSFSELPEADKDTVRLYPFSVQMFQGISDPDVYEIFSRLNTYSVPLNKQELRNGRFFGKFKQSVYATAHSHVEFWRRNSIFAHQSVARMLDAEFVGEVFVAFLHGMQDKKKSLDGFYEMYDERFPKQHAVEKWFEEVIDEVNESLDGVISESIFRRPPLLYTLLCVLFHRRHGLPSNPEPTPKAPLARGDRMALREAVETLSHKVKDAARGVEPGTRYSAFVKACQQQTDNIKPRQTRFTMLYRTSFPKT